MAEKEQKTTAPSQAPRVFLDRESARRLLQQAEAQGADQGRVFIMFDTAAIEEALGHLGGLGLVEVEGVIVERAFAWPFPRPDPVSFYESFRTRPDIVELMSRLAK